MNRLIIGAVGVLAVVWAIYFYGQRKFDAGYSQAQAEYTEAANKAIETARAEDARRINEQNEVIKNAQIELSKISADVANANDVSRRLRIQLDAIRTRSASVGTTATARGETVADTLGVLTNVLAESDRRAGELAQIADESRARGLTCELMYGALSNVNQ